MSWDTEDATPLAGRKVLVVEDQYLIADDLCRMVEQLGGQVLGPTSRLSSALAALEAEPPDLALLDVNLGEETVYPVAAALQAAGIPFLFTTGYDAAVIDTRFAAAPHLAKPIGQGLLGEAARRLLNGRGH
ncbi:response regulator [Roseococcus sp. SYP-B2431]|uniref:response regulator n=1 Tax=Roseococcus sp. SYP-B2431 TaxID=2496640 RepID=UPI001040CB4A|nr:response regulator [Roseococcus sp. SYP-B2431]TCH98127.1 response regulator [Roseococcus sp. SYP-B2431]